VSRNRFFVDLSSDCAVQDISDPSSNGPIFVTLSAGGIALLTAPDGSIDGRVLRLDIAGRVHIPGSSDGSVNIAYYLYTGNSVPGLNVTINGCSATFHGDRNFFATVDCVWDSVAQRILIAGGGGAGLAANNMGLGTTVVSSPVTSFGNVQFAISGQSSISGSSLSVTQFSLQLEG